MIRFDERDTMFSRMELVPGSENYNSYYARRPEFKAADDHFRSASPGKYASDLVNMSRIDSAFRFLKDLRPLAYREDNSGGRCPGQPVLREIEKALHETALDYGAALYGQASLGLECLYSIRGRGPAYGEPVVNPLRNALVFAVDMNRDKISYAPQPEEAVEVTRAYVRVAVIGMILSYLLKELGYRARCHMDGESELVLPAAAQAAGLGKIGRLGLLLSREYGPLIRLGAVTTDFPLTSALPGGGPLTPEPEEYCFSCVICARRCPGRAIPFEEAGRTGSPDQSEMPWVTDHAACFGMWQKFGTDCGICISVCPFGKQISQG